ncbi:MAG: hypothetical protein Q4B77_03355 [Coriobacteriaceae bacterium]|nr:hypothetical protein [Coriobacteriaceae bacterium]
MHPMQSEPLGQLRTVAAPERPGLGIRDLVLLAILLAAGFILNFTAGKAIAAVSGGAIAPEFIIAAFCLTILIVRPTIPQSLVIGFISAAVIQLTTTAPGIDFIAESLAAIAMATIVQAGAPGCLRALVPAVGTFVATLISGTVFVVIKMMLMGFATQIALVMLPVVTATSLFNAVLVCALYPPVKAALALEE